MKNEESPTPAGPDGTDAAAKAAANAGGMGLRVLPVTPLRQNCSLIWCAKTMRGAFVDPGDEPERLLASAKALGVTIDKLLVTHGHIDHCGRAAVLAEMLQVPILGPQRADKFWIDMNPALGAEYGIPGARAFTPDRWLEQGDEVQVGELTLAVLHTPGHTPGHVVFHHAPARIAFVGDVLFRGSIGRTDFPQGNFDELIRSITEKLWPLGNDTRFIPGHGPSSTFGAERQSNPFVGDAVLRRA